MLPVRQVSSELFRSPQPDFEDLIFWKERGLRSLVNLREEATESSFFARQAKLEYKYIPVVDWELPSFEQVQEFLKFVAHSGPTLVHCAAGVGRTGTMVACYRVFRGMATEEALKTTNNETPIAGVTMNEIQLNFVREFAHSTELGRKIKESSEPG